MAGTLPKKWGTCLLPGSEFAKAAQTGDRVDLWRARLALKTLRLDQRQAIAEAAEG